MNLLTTWAKEQNILSSPAPAPLRIKDKKMQTGRGKEKQSSVALLYSPYKSCDEYMSPALAGGHHAFLAASGGLSQGSAACFLPNEFGVPLRIKQNGSVRP